MTMKKPKISPSRGSIIISTFQSKESANKVAKQMVAKKLCACVNIAKINSIYFWNNKMQNHTEYLCLFKTISSSKLMHEIKKIHQYEVPEIVEVKMNTINKDYLGWLVSTAA